MEKQELTHFQTWVLFMTFEESNNWFTERDLLMKCCASSLRRLKIECLDEELRFLVKEKYLKAVGRGHSPFDQAFSSFTGSKPVQAESEPKYQINNAGIVYVRRLYMAFENAVMDGKISPASLSREAPSEPESKSVSSLRSLLLSEIRNKTPQLETFLMVGVKSIEIVVMIITILE